MFFLLKLGIIMNILNKIYKVTFSLILFLTLTSTLFPTISDPVTLVLSKRGWIRAAKGHDIDPESLNFREGDSYFASSLSRNNLNAVFLDSKGKAYTLPCHSLPSARGQGEPLSGRLNAESGETFMGVISGKDDAKVVLASSSGYGFIAQLIDLQTKNKSGKAAIRVQENAKVLKPCLVDSENDYIAAITKQGRMLVFPCSELPQLARGKGNKIIGIPKPSFESGEDFLQEVITLREGEELKFAYRVKNGDTSIYINGDEKIIEYNGIVMYPLPSISLSKNLDGGFNFAMGFNLTSDISQLSLNASRLFGSPYLSSAYGFSQFFDYTTRKTSNFMSSPIIQKDIIKLQMGSLDWANLEESKITISLDKEYAITEVESSDVINFKRVYLGSNSGYNFSPPHWPEKPVERKGEFDQTKFFDLFGRIMKIASSIAPK